MTTKTLAQQFFRPGSIEIGQAQMAPESPEPTTVTVHPWADAGVGQAPFTVVDVISLPSTSLAEANTTAYNNAMASAWERARSYKVVGGRPGPRQGVGLGSCDYCGNGIMHNFVVRDGAGCHFVVGCDCARKSGDSKVITEAENLERLRKKALAEEKRRERWERKCQEREAREEEERQRNGGLTDHEVAEAIRGAAEKKRKEARLKVVGHLTIQLFNMRSDFHNSLARQLISGNLSYRQAEYVCKACVGTTGRRNKKNAQEWDDTISLCMGHDDLEEVGS